MKSRVYGAYLFKTKDPVIDELRTMVQDIYGSINHKSLTAIERAGGPTASAMTGWFFGETLRPQNPSAEAAGRAMGFKRTWVPITAKDRRKIEKWLAQRKRASTKKVKAKKH